MRRPRRNHSAAFKAKVAIAALKGDEPLENLAGEEHRITPARHMIIRDATLLRTRILGGVGRAG